MKKEVLVSTLLSMRSQIDAILYYIDELVEEEENQKIDEIEEVEEECEHKNRVSLNTMGTLGRSWLCKDCGLNYKGGNE